MSNQTSQQSVISPANSRLVSILDGPCVLEWVPHLDGNLLDIKLAHLAGEIEGGNIGDRNADLIGVKLLSMQ